MVEEKETARVDSKELEEYSLVKNNDLGWSEEDGVLVVQRKKRQERFSNGENHLSESFFRTCQPSEEGYRHSWESEDWYSSLTDDSSCSTSAWYGTGYIAWMASVPFETCQPSDERCSGSWLHTVDWIKSDNQKGFQKLAFHYSITTEFCRSNKCLFCQLR